MKLNFTPQLAVLAVLLGSLLLLSACATTTPSQPAIEDRAQQRWDTLLSGDLAGAYEFLSPGYRSSVSSLQYQRSLLLKRVKWNSAKYIGSECEENTCNVRFSLGFTVYGAIPGVKAFNGNKDIYESWVLIDRVWYYVPEQ